MSTLRLAQESGLSEKPNLKALFEVFEVPWDEAKSKEVFAKVMAKLEERERRRRWVARLARTAGMAMATALGMVGTYGWLTH